MNDPEPLLTLRDVSCGYTGRLILKHVSFEVRTADMWFLLGANGAGKSTLLKVILGLLVPSAGKILRAHGRTRPTRIGFVPQHAARSSSLPSTIREFVGLGFVGLQTSGSDRSETMERCLATVGLAGRETEDIGSLSGGTRQRAVLARALVRNPNLLILDEPTNHLDPAAERDFLDLLKGLNADQDMSVVFVTHDLAVASSLATHVGLFREGEVLAGPREQMLTETGLRALYGTTRTVNESDSSTRSGRNGGHR